MDAACSFTPIREWKKNCFGLAPIVYVTFVDVFFCFFFIFQYVCRLEQGWLELAQNGLGELARATGVEDLVFTKNPPAKIEWLKKGVERQIERKRFWKK